jgi:acetyltransferase-like isoleucine patch superfamily enzyme
VTELDGRRTRAVRIDQEVSRVMPAPVVHPTAIVADWVSLGERCVVGAFVCLGEAGLEAGQEPERLTIGADAMVRSHSVIYAGSRIGDGLQTGHGVLIREATVIGDSVSVGSHSVVEHHVTIGHRVRLHSNVFVPEFSILEDGCWIGPNVVLTNARYPRSRDVKETLRGPRVLAGAMVGANVTVLPGVTIGEYALVGAGAVVTKDVPPRTVVVGNPVRPSGQVDDLEAYRGLLPVEDGTR